MSADSPAIPAWLRAEYPFVPRSGTTPRGARMSYLDEGPRDNAAVLMLHGNPTWSFYYRRLVQALAPADQPRMQWHDPRELARGLGRMIWWSAPQTRSFFFKMSTYNPETFDGRGVVPCPGLVFMANDRQLRDLTFWTLGSLSGASWPRIAVLLPFVAASGACLPLLVHPLNALLLGEAEAFHMGAGVERAKRISLFVVASAVGASVSAVGIISFIGVLVPHLMRLSAGPDHRVVLPGSALLGAILLLLSDTAARTIAAPAEMPVGIVTAVIGAPCFFWLLLRHRGATG